MPVHRTISTFVLIYAPISTNEHFTAVIMASISSICLLLTFTLYAVVDCTTKRAGDEVSMQLGITTSENIFIKTLENAINSQLGKGVKYFKDHLRVTNVTEFDKQLSTKEYSFMQIFYGLVSGQELYTNLFVRTGEFMRNDDVSQIQSWLTNSFNFSSDDVQLAVVNYVEWDLNALGNYSDILSELILNLAKEYRVPDKLSRDNEVRTLSWVLRYESVSKSVSPELFEENWNKGNSEVVKTMLRHGAINNRGIANIVKNLSKNEDFIKFLVTNEIEEALVFLMSENLFDPVSIVSHIIKENKTNFLKYFIVKNSTNNESVVLKEFLNSPIFGGEVTLLYKSIENKNIDAKNIFLNAGADANAVSQCNKTLLHTAVSQAKVDIVRELIKHNAKVNMKDCKGLTPVDYAVNSNNSEILGLLFKSGSPRDTGSLDLMYKLYERNDTEKLNLLFKAGADVNAVFGCNTTLLHKAVTQGVPYIVEKLIMHGADVYAMECNGMTPMHTAIMRDNQNMISLLSTKQFNINKIFDDGTSVISFAAINGSIETLTTLIKLGGNVDIIGGNDNTPLFEALLRNRTDIVQCLLNHGANINLKLSKGNSYLHRAVHLGSPVIVNHLVVKGIKVDEFNDNGETPLAIAVKRNHHVLVNVLVKNGAITSRATANGDTYLHLAVRNNSAQALQALLAQGAPADSRVRIGDTAMWLAVKKDDVVLLEILKSFGADINQRNKWTYTLHHEAAFSDSPNAIAWLAKNGLSVDVTDTNTKTTPLHLAAYAGNIRAVEQLLNLKPCVNCRDDTGSTPLYTAEYYHRNAIANLIRSAGGVES